MIPLHDTIKSEKFPVVNWMLIFFNAFVFFIELRLGSGETEAFFYKYGMVPARTNPAGVNTYTLISYMFLHGGWGHFLGNMWFLYIFGDNVEDRMGSFRYLVFYLLCGIMAGLTHFVLYRTSMVPAIGASGAISGVMAAYMFLFPGSLILSFVPLFFLPLLLPIPAIIYIGLWFIGQFLSGTLHLLQNSPGTGIAFWAHIGGFAGGWIIYRAFVRKKKRKV
ncbi:MAG: rhomboid family intramembrane serine protease [Bacteroidales bacterium]|jgi:membrane associated rhomboid family serine protease